MLTKLLSYQFWFQTGFVSLSRADKIYFGLSGLMFVFAIALWIYSKGVSNVFNKDLMHRWANLFCTIGILGLLWTFLRYEAVQTLSSHLFAGIIFAAGLIWAYFVFRFWMKEHKTLKEDYEREQLKKKYL